MWIGWMIEKYRGREHYHDQTNGQNEMYLRREQYMDVRDGDKTLGWKLYHDRKDDLKSIWNENNVRTCRIVEKCLREETVSGPDGWPKTNQGREQYMYLDRTDGLKYLGREQYLDRTDDKTYFIVVIIIIIIIIIIYPLTARFVWATQMISLPVSSFFPCSPLPSGTWPTPGLSIPWCCLPTSSSVCLVFIRLSLCLARWFWPDVMNGRHYHTTAVCVSLWWSGGLHVVWLPAGSWHGLPQW